jgi:hypothetical protein
VTDLSVVSVKCGNCKIDSIGQFAGVLGVVVAGAAATIALLLLLLHLYSKIKRRKYRTIIKKQFEEIQRKTFAERKPLV